MDYKKIIRNKKLRLKILDHLGFVPDSIMLKIQYRLKTGRKLNLKKPQRWTEKIQWYKINYRDPLMAKCVDKYSVRSYVRKMGLGSILNECYGIFNNPEEINFDNLPNEFVLKDTLAGGSSSVIICKDKEKADLLDYKREMHRWINANYKSNFGREWVYDGRKHRIIIDKYIDPECSEGLIDYKFFCFNGEPSHLLVISDRFTEEKLDLYDLRWNKLDVVQSDCPNQRVDKLPRPQNFDKMIEIARILSKPFPHVRVDLYNIKGHIIFGELTFFSASGYYIFTPDKFDYILGKKFLLPDKK